MVHVLRVDEKDMESYLYREIKEKHPNLWCLVESKRIDPKMAIRAYHMSRAGKWDVMTALGIQRGSKWLTFD
jgi:hypothetical protein